MFEKDPLLNEGTSVLRTKYIRMKYISLSPPPPPTPRPLSLCFANKDPTSVFGSSLSHLNQQANERALARQKKVPLVEFMYLVIDKLLKATEVSVVMPSSYA